MEASSLWFKVPWLPRAHTTDKHSIGAYYSLAEEASDWLITNELGLKG